MFKLLLVAALVVGGLFAYQKVKDTDVDIRNVPATPQYVVPDPPDVHVNVPNPNP